MAGRVTSFASGSNLAIHIGDVHMAYITNLSWSDDVAHAAIGGIGSFNYDALEPLQYIARGSFSLIRYGSEAYNRIAGTGANNFAPSRSAAGPTVAPNVGDGNSMLRGPHFNPSQMLTSRTFDIVVYERKADGTLSDQKVATIQDCRMTGYSITFTPGQVVGENIGFMCILALDEETQDSASAGG